MILSELIQYLPEVVVDDEVVPVISDVKTELELTPPTVFYENDCSFFEVVEHEIKIENADEEESEILTLDNALQQDPDPAAIADCTMNSGTYFVSG